MIIKIENMSNAIAIRDDSEIYPQIYPIEEHKNTMNMCDKGETIAHVVYYPNNDSTLFEDVKNNRVRNLGRLIYPILEKEEILLDIHRIRFKLCGPLSERHFIFALYSDKEPSKVLEIFEKACNLVLNIGG